MQLFTDQKQAQACISVWEKVTNKTLNACLHESSKGWILQSTDAAISIDRMGKIPPAVEVLTKRQKFALELLLCGLNTNEIAHAMSWTFSETQVELRRIQRLSQKKVWVRKAQK
jgi:DNA-binding NarL/FixJ family response regulator